MTVDVQWLREAQGVPYSAGNGAASADRRPGIDEHATAYRLAGNRTGPQYWATVLLLHAGWTMGQAEMVYGEPAFYTLTSPSGGLEVTPEVGQFTLEINYELPGMDPRQDSWQPPADEMTTVEDVGRLYAPPYPYRHLLRDF